MARKPTTRATFPERDEYVETWREEERDEKPRKMSDDGGKDARR